MRKDQKPVIVKRVKRVNKGGHHGGAWKVAYADFVTAMMAFFLLMWLLSVTSEEQRRGLADFFAPELPIFNTAGGGDGPFEGSRSFLPDPFPQEMRTLQQTAAAEGAPADEEPWDFEDTLAAFSGDAFEADPLLQHVRTRVTDEGLIIEVFDIDGSPLFVGATDRPTVVLERLVDMIGRVLARTANPVAVTGHLALSSTAADPWRLSVDRAQSVQGRLVRAGVVEGRMARVTGKADRSPLTEARDDPRNGRIEITLLRRFAP